MLVGRSLQRHVGGSRDTLALRQRNYFPGEYSWGILPVMSVPLTLLGYRLEADLRWIDHTAARLDLLARAVHQ